MRRILYIFGQLSDLDVEWLSDVGEPMELAAGGTLIRQGVHSPHLFFLIGGALSVEVEGVGKVAELLKGEVVGEMSFIDSNPPGASVKAAADSLLLAIDKTKIVAHMEEAPDFAGRFYKALAIFLTGRLRDTTLQLRGQKPKREEEEEVESRLDDSVLKTVHLAAYRFNRMLDKVQDASRGRQR